MKPALAWFLFSLRLAVRLLAMSVMIPVGIVFAMMKFQDPWEGADFLLDVWKDWLAGRAPTSRPSSAERRGFTDRATQRLGG